MNVEEYFAEREARDPEFRAAWEEQRPQFELERALIKARLAAGLTQQQLADRLGKKQSAIARLESGKHPPRLDTLVAIARAVGAAFIVEPDGRLRVESRGGRRLAASRRVPTHHDAADTRTPAGAGRAR
ncbi:MAG TPA: helix-turn-helix transcriptional regulator [Chloroflexota bacterium]|nr:helix-turn-helix transcriptional regulator [Chloroflexota bacterium]